MNAGFVCVKVDREERPDIDAVYMNATVAMTGQGGWPMTCFLTPDGRPFFCGTYYPESGFPGTAFGGRSTRGATAATRSNRPPITSQANCGRWRPALPGGGPAGEPALCDDAVAAVLRDEDTVRGGFGGAPKFPPSALLEALLRHYERTGSSQALDAVGVPATAMARGGIYDQLAGGSPATASTTLGWYRISRRCSTTMRCCCGSMRTGPAAPEIRWPGGSPARPHVSSSTSWPTPTCSPRRWTPTPTAGRVRPTCGRPAQLTRSARRRRRALGRFGFRGYRGRNLRSRRIGAAVADRP